QIDKRRTEDQQGESKDHPWLPPPICLTPARHSGPSTKSTAGNAASAFSRQGHGNTRANAVLSSVAPDVSAMCSDDVLTEVQANPCAFSFFGIDLSVVFNAEELLEDTLPKRHWNARTSIRHGKI